MNIYAGIVDVDVLSIETPLPYVKTPEVYNTRGGEGRKTIAIYDAEKGHEEEFWEINKRVVQYNNY